MPASAQRRQAACEDGRPESRRNGPTLVARPASAKHVLVVSSHFPPERAAGVHRILRIAKQLRASAWPVDVLTVDPKHYRAGTPTDPGLLDRVPDGTQVHRTAALRGLVAIARWRRIVRRSVTGMVGRLLGSRTNGPEQASQAPHVQTPSVKRPYIDTEIGWFFPAIREGARLISRQRPEIIFSSAPPFTCHLVAGWLARRYGIKWVADFRDPWARSPWKRADLTDTYKIRLREWLERLVVARADAVILNTPLLRDEFAAYYGPRLAAKFHSVTNGYDVEPLARHLVPSNGHGASRLVLTHAGSLYRQRDPRPLVRALSSAIGKGLIAADGIELNFVGSVSPEFRLAETVAELGLSSVVRLTPPVSHDQAMQHLVRADALIVIQPGTRLQVPVKLYEYLPFQKPILALAPEGALTAIAERSGLGLVAAPDDSQAIERAICQLYEHRHQLAERFQPDAAYIGQFEGGAVSRQMQRILETV